MRAVIEAEAAGEDAALKAEEGPRCENRPELLVPGVAAVAVAASGGPGRCRFRSDAEKLEC